jgi:hypothetical protein
MFVISGLVDIGTLMTRYGVPPVSSPKASRAAPRVVPAPNRPLPRAALVVADAARLISSSGPVNADCVSRGVACPRREGSGAAGFVQKKVRADDLSFPID